jgi:hypothetical protein
MSAVRQGIAVNNYSNINWSVPKMAARVWYSQTHEKKWIHVKE